jgi:hypothetical protein
MTTSKDWGPKLWYSLHVITFNYPDNPSIFDKQNYETFFTSLQYVIPCSICREHYKKNLEKNPIQDHLSDKVSLSKWLVEIHNQVNIMLGKPTMSFEEVVKIYEKKNSQTFNYWYILILIVVIIIGYYILIKKRKNIYRY